jgi:glucokinase
VAARTFTLHAGQLFADGGGLYKVEISQGSLHRSCLVADAADYDIQGIGIGCTGPLDIGKGILLDVENLPTLNYFPLKDTVEQAFPLRVILDNDANALIYAEALWGAGRNAGSVLGFTLGTGIGCAWINGGKVWRGHSGCAGEVWTSPYKEGILEDYVSGNAVTRLYKEYTKEELQTNQGLRNEH